jgi:hypothetical protein
LLLFFVCLVAGYKDALNTWIQALILVIQEATKGFLEQLTPLLPMSGELLEQEMKARCEQVCTHCSLQTAEAQYGISATELEAISQRLSIYSDSLFEQYRQENKQLLHKFETQVEEVYLLINALLVSSLLN